MNAAVRKLPIGIQSFEDIRNQGFLYVDKTALIYKMATMGKPYFLSRPRRFGKSLLLSTIEAYFQGKRELFKGLAIEKLETDWLEYPVLHLDLNAEKYTSIEALTYILERHINGWEDTWGKDTRENSLSDRFIGVITRAYEKTGRQVVVLIDEYDKPLLQVFNDEKLQTEYLKTLKAFYGVLKSADRYLRFVFNPFSLLNTLSFSRFGSYWFQTGTPTFLVELLKQSEYDLRTLIDGVEMKESAFSEYRVAENNPIPLIYQSGYLTIKDYDERFHLYTLRFPNDEVKYGFLDFITPFYTSVGDEDNGFYIGKFVRELESGDVDSFLTRLKAFFADFSYELNDKTERHYQVVFYLVFKQMGQFCDAEVRSARGRADAVVKTQDSIYIFEFKLNGSAEAALKQINDKGYLIPYMADNRKQIKVGVMFDASERNIGQWLIEE
ncbi:ATP-binding protein [Parabacteroides goldsteinii]|uniref:ATP-binding protein n=1 Tax=Parabacteroides goldsteinii TaxID=328812 RepID=UPI001CCAF9A7|nr:ATP-binding protein [Parabacteroides goldsteinii]UBD77753.1 ATP-binding protein [Parabacteroides goldsteinii]